MKICVPVRIGECRTLLRQNLDSRFDFGMERHIGWVIAYFFSMSYHSKNEIRLLDGLIFHKAMGFLSGKKENTSVYFVVFKGLTDPISIFFLFSVSFLAFWFAWERKGASFLTCIFWPCCARYQRRVQPILFQPFLQKAGGNGNT